MARSKSGRVVIETDPDLKRRLYMQLARDERTLKEWFTEVASAYVEQKEQPPLFHPDPERKSGKRRSVEDENQ
jgi:hypothetical protein